MTKICYARGGFGIVQYYTQATSSAHLVQMMLKETSGRRTPSAVSMIQSAAEFISWTANEQTLQSRLEQYTWNDTQNTQI